MMTPSLISSSLIISLHLGAVDGGAEGVTNVDVALAGDARDKAEVEAGIFSGDALQAAAGSLAVGGGAGGCFDI